MAPTILHACILQATTRTLIYRKCATCGSKILPVTHNYDLGVVVGAIYYCPGCDKDVDMFKSNYELALIVSVSNGERIQPITVYDEAVTSLLGCTAEKLGDLLLERPTLIDDIEERLIGMKCHFVTRQDKKKGRSKKGGSDKVIAEAIIPADPLYQPVFVEGET